MHSENVYISLSGIYFLLQKYKEHQTYVDFSGNAVPMQVTEILAVFDAVALLETDKTDKTSIQTYW